MYNKRYLKMFQRYFLIFRYPGVSKIILVLRAGDTSTNLEIINMRRLLVSPISESKIIIPNRTGIILGSFQTYYFHKLTIQMTNKWPNGF